MQINKLTLLIILLIILLFFITPISRVLSIDYLFANDTWHHLYFSIHSESQKIFSNSIQFYDGNVESHYPTLMRSLIYTISELTGINPFDLFKYFGFFCRALTVLICFKLFSLISGKRSLGIIGIILLLGGYYFWYRSYLTFTENFVIVFQALIMYYSYLALSKKSIKHLALCGLFTTTSLYYHSPSAIIPGILFTSTTLTYLWINLGSKNKQFYCIVITLLCAVITIPISKEIIGEYIGQISNNVGSTEGYGSKNRFYAPTIETYINFQSHVIIILGLIGMCFIAKYKKISLIPIMAITISTFILSNGVRFNLNLPVDRMQSFIMLPFVIIGLFSISKIKNNYINIGLIFITLILSLQTAIETKSWHKTWKGHIPLGGFLNETYDSNKKYYFEEGVSYEDTRFAYHKSIILKKSSLQSGDYIITSTDCGIDQVKINTFNKFNVCEKK